MQSARNWERSFGAWRVDLIECGRLALDGGAMFGSVPRVLWERLIAPDATHRIPLALRLLLLRHESGAPNVLVDTGVGDKFDAKFAGMYAVANPAAGPGETPLEGALRAAGQDPEGITHVILTHLHFDHGGGVTRGGPAGATPTFPRAEHILQTKNLATAERPNPRERASYFPENVQPLKQAKLTLLDGLTEDFLPGVSLIPSDGHTAGLQLVRVEGGGRVLYYLSDLAPTQHHLHLPYSMGYDLCARTVMDEKTILLARILEERALVVFEHDPVLGAATLQFEAGKYRVASGS